MKCPNCNKIIKKTDIKCKFCGKKTNEKLVQKEIVKPNINCKDNDNKCKYLLLVIGLLSFILVLETSFNIWYFYIKTPIEDIKLEITTFNYIPNLPYKLYLNNESFEFDDLSISLLNNYKIIQLDNNYSIYNGQQVIKIPVKVTNNKSDKYSLNLYYYDLYDEYGNEIDEVAGYFDESLYYAEDLDSESSYIKYIYALYYNNKSLIIRFENTKETILVKYNIR